MERSFWQTIHYRNSFQRDFFFFIRIFLSLHRMLSNENVAFFTHQSQWRSGGRKKCFFPNICLSLYCTNLISIKITLKHVQSLSFCVFFRSLSEVEQIWKIKVFNFMHKWYRLLVLLQFVIVKKKHRIRVTFGTLSHRSTFLARNILINCIIWLKNGMHLCPPWFSAFEYLQNWNIPTYICGKIHATQLPNCYYKIQSIIKWWSGANQTKNKLEDQQRINNILKKKITHTQQEKLFIRK